MSFWNLNDGTEVEADNNFEMGGGNIEPIPDNTDLLSAIEEASWDDYEGDRYISIKWRVMQPQEYANRVVFQKVKVYGDKGDKAKRMLAAIDANAGGKLRQVQGEPTDEQLMMALAGKTMITKVMVWDFNGKTGNWVCAVSPSSKSQPEQKTETHDDIPW